MFKKCLILFAVLLLVLAAAYPQGKSKGQGGGQNQGKGQSQGQVIGQGQRKEAGGSQASGAQTDQKRVKVTKQQRNQIRDCDKLADDIEKRARKMARDSEDKFNWGQINQQQVHLQNQIRKMEQEHERLINGLDPNQQQAWKEQIQNMNRLRQQINLHERQIDDELKANPDGKRIAERVREMERTMNEWRNQYRVLLSQTD